MKVVETIVASAGAVALGAACALCAGLATPARADVTDELLEIMKAKGDLTEEQYKSLKGRHQKEKAESARRSEPKADKAVTVALKKPPSYADLPPPPAKDDALSTSYVTALPAATFYTENKGQGVGIRIGSFEFETRGDISAFAIEDTQQSRFIPIDGALLPSGKANDAFAVRDGLLPSSLQFEVRTNQEGYDIAAHFSMFVGGNNVNPSDFNANGSGFPVALGTAGIDFRQAYGTISTSSMGTFKFGRDLGLFGAEAILFDASILGSGTPGNNSAPSNTTLARIGIGYVYADWIPQITWTSPDIYGFTFSAGIFTPLNAYDAGDTFFTRTLAASADLTGQDAPMVQWRLKYVGNLGEACGLKDTACAEGLKLTAWTSGVYQDHQVETTDIANGTIIDQRPGASITSWGVDGGVKIDWAGFSFVGYGYTGDGLGTTGLFWNGVSINGQTRTSDGGYVQGSYTWDRVTFGGSWGISALDRNPEIDPVTLQKQINSEIGFVRYKLTDWVQFQGEYVHTEQQNYANCASRIGCTIYNDAVIGGTTFFW
jgi:hypothetical protein